VKNRRPKLDWTDEELEWLFTPEELAGLKRSREAEWLTPEEWAAKRHRESAQRSAPAPAPSPEDFRFPDPKVFRVQVELQKVRQELEQARSQIRDLISARDAAWAVAREAEKNCAAAEKESREAWAEVVRLTLADDFTLSEGLLKRLILFVHPDKHQQASAAIRTEANDLVVELIKLKNG
jgi:hypothetical protein